MATEEDLTRQTTARLNWQSKQVYSLAAICLLLGVVLGYFFRGSQSPAAPAQVRAAQPALTQTLPPQAQAAPAANVAPSASAAGMPEQMPTLDDMKRMADSKAQPLLAKLKSDPKNSDLLIEVGNIYEKTHQFEDAAGYYEKALEVKPENVAIRTEMASCLYYGGDVDGAIRQLQQSLTYDPKDVNSLFNLGMIKWQGKQDSGGAVSAWHELLKSNPELSPDRKAMVEKLIADVEKKSKG